MAVRSKSRQPEPKARGREPARHSGFQRIQGVDSLFAMQSVCEVAIFSPESDGFDPRKWSHSPPKVNTPEQKVLTEIQEVLPKTGDAADDAGFFADPPRCFLGGESQSPAVGSPPAWNRCAALALSHSFVWRKVKRFFLKRQAGQGKIARFCHRNLAFRMREKENEGEKCKFFGHFCRFLLDKCIILR